jgi:hypothetical protein
MWDSKPQDLEPDPAPDKFWKCWIRIRIWIRIRLHEHRSAILHICSFGGITPLALMQRDHAHKIGCAEIYHMPLLGNNLTENGKGPRF